MRGTTKTYNCKSCGNPFIARVADRKRGWARFCSKSCKAKRQEKRTGQHAKFLQSRDEDMRDYEHRQACAEMEEGWDGHKNAF